VAALAEDAFSIEAMLDSAMQFVDEALRGIDAAYDAVLALWTSLTDSQDVLAELLQLLSEDPLLALAVLLCPLLLLFLLVSLLRRRRALAQPAQESADAMALDMMALDTAGLNTKAPATGFAMVEPSINDDRPADSKLLTPANAAPSGPDKPAVGGVELDFDLDFDTDPKPSVSAEQAWDGSTDTTPLTPGAVQPALDAEALPLELAPPAGPAAPATMLDFEVEAGESSPLETTLSAAASYQDTVLDFDLTEDAAAPTPAASATIPNVASSERPAINFEGISLELDPPLAAASADSSAPTLPKTEVVSTDSAPEAVWQEVEIKLDLAKAYLEMTDREGARELLKEAIAEGDAAQQQRAKTMLDSLA
jgi:pilus assembly protein FimV